MQLDRESVRDSLDISPSPSFQSFNIGDESFRDLLCIQILTSGHGDFLDGNISLIPFHDQFYPDVILVATLDEANVSPFSDSSSEVDLIGFESIPLRIEEEVGVSVVFLSLEEFGGSSLAKLQPALPVIYPPHIDEDFHLCSLKILLEPLQICNFPICERV